MKADTLISVFVVIFTCLLGDSEQSSFEDERCVCACPRSLCPKGTGPFFIKMIPASDCTCPNVVPPVQSNRSTHQDICQFCECKHEVRNTTTIKVVVVFIICIVMLLMVYMLFLMCLDPLLHKKRPRYMRHIDDDATLDNFASIQATPGREVSGTATAGAATVQRSLLNRMTSEQQKWRGTVEEQRRNIYDNHSMLN